MIDLSLPFRLMKRFGVYIFANGLEAALPFFLLPILTSYLAPAEYGMWETYRVSVYFFTPLIAMSLQTNITRTYFQRNQQEVGQVVYNILVVLCIATCASYALVYLYQLFFSTGDIAIFWYLLIPPIALTTSLTTYILTLFRNRGQAISYAIYQVGRRAFNLATAVLLIVFVGLGWEGMSYALLISSVSVGVISLLHMKKMGFINPKVDRSLIQEILQVSLPLIPYGLSATVINLADRLFLNKMLGADIVGIYSVGYQFGMGMVLFVDAFSRIFSPWMYEQLATITYTRKIKVVRYTYAYMIGIFGLALIVTVASWILIPLMTDARYAEAVHYVPLIAVAYAFRGIYTVVFPYAVHVGKTGYLAVIMVVAAALHLVTNYFFILWFDAVGAALSTVLAFVVIFLWTWRYTQRIYPMPWLSALRFWQNSTPS